MEHELQPETTRKFDEPTAQKILALAARLQDEDVGRISEEQLHEIAAEAGVSTEFVRAAIESVEQQQHTPVRAARMESELARIPLSKALAVVAVSTALLTIPGFFSAYSRALTLWVCVMSIAVVLVLAAAYRTRMARYGLATGAFGAAIMGALIWMLEVVLHPVHYVDLADLVLMVVVGCIAGAIAGAIGALVTRFRARKRRALPAPDIG